MVAVGSRGANDGKWWHWLDLTNENNDKERKVGSKDGGSNKADIVEQEFFVLGVTMPFSRFHCFTRHRRVHTELRPSPEVSHDE